MTYARKLATEATIKARGAIGGVDAATDAVERVIREALRHERERCAAACDELAHRAAAFAIRALPDEEAE